MLVKDSGDSTFGEDSCSIIHVDDMVKLKPFEGAANRTSVVIAEKERRLHILSLILCGVKD